MPIFESHPRPIASEFLMVNLTLNLDNLLVLKSKKEYLLLLQLTTAAHQSHL